MVKGTTCISGIRLDDPMMVHSRSHTDLVTACSYVALLSYQQWDRIDLSLRFIVERL